MMKLALTVNCWSDEDLMFAQQFGVNHIVAEAVMPSPDAVDWNESVLAGLRNRVEKAGLELIGIENLPYLYQKAILGEPGRDEEIEVICRFIRNAGAAGISILRYRWTVLDYNPTNRIPNTDEQRWDHLTYFLERVIPVAEKAGVKMACHPDHLSLSALPDVPRILSSVEGLKRLLEIVNSPCNGLDFCQGTIAMMPGTDVIEAIRLFGLKEKIFLVHLSNPKGRLSSLTEVFMDEGDTDILRALQTYREVGFDGAIRPVQPPEIVDDTDWGHKGKAFAVGYLRALLQVAERY